MWEVSSTSLLFECWACKRVSLFGSDLWCPLQFLSLLLARPFKFLTHCSSLYQERWWGKAAEWRPLPSIRRCFLCLYTDHHRPSWRRKEDLSVLWMCTTSCIVLCWQSKSRWLWRVTEVDETPEKTNISIRYQKLPSNSSQEQICTAGTTDICVAHVHRCVRHIHLKFNFAYVAFKVTLRIFAAVGTLRSNKDRAKQVGYLQCAYRFYVSTSQCTKSMLENAKLYFEHLGIAMNCCAKQWK